LGGNGSRQKQCGRKNQNSQTRFNVFHGLIPARDAINSSRFPPP
jgi:hypothetical protein